MQCTFRQLREKEVISVSDGKRLGYVCDLELEMETGQVFALVVPGPARFFGLFGRRENYVIPWKDICKVGPDIILVEGKLHRRPIGKNR